MNSVMQKIGISPKQFSGNLAFGCAAAALVIALWPVSTAYMRLATLSYLMLAQGYRLRKTDPRAHGMLMLTGIVSDLALVLILEFQRHAIKTAMSFELTPLQQSHIASATVATLLYIPTLVLGLLLLFKPELRNKLRKSHARIATAAFVFRTVSFILMFSMLSHVQAH